MLKSVFDKSSNNSQNKFHTSLFVQKRCFKTNYIESSVEDDIDLRNQYRTENLPDPIRIREACSNKQI